jgi:ABC-2 type transport system permease protein
MLSRLFTIASHYWRTTLLSRNVFIFALAMPLVFTFVLGSVLARGDQPSRWSLALVDEDGSRLSQALHDRLLSAPGLEVDAGRDRATALAAVEADDLVAALIIGPGFGAALERGETTALELVTSSTQLRPAQSVEQAAAAAVSELGGMVQSAAIAAGVVGQLGLAAPAGARDAPFAEALERAQTVWSGELPASVRSQPLTRLANIASIPNGMAQSSPGMLVTFALVFLLNGAGVIILERTQGTLRRLLVMPMSKAVILGGKLLGIFVAGLAQAAILILAGQFLFGVEWGQAPVALALMVLAATFAIASLGMMIAGLARTFAQAAALSNILMYSIAAIGGAWWPIEITPAWMQQLARLTPTFWAMQGYNDIITRGLGLPAVLPETLVLLGFGVIFLAFGVWRFRYE